MTDYQIQSTFKYGKDHDEAWVTIASNDPDEFLQYLGEFKDRIAKDVAEVATEVRALNAVARGLGSTQVHAVTEGATVTQHPAVAQAAAPVGDLPDGVRIWVAPNPDPDKSQYEELWFEYPFVGGSDGKAFRDGLKKALGGFAVFHGETKHWWTKKDNETTLRNYFAQNAGVFSK